MPSIGTVPSVGLNPTTPHSAEGTRNEARVSVPSEARPTPVATAITILAGPPGDRRRVVWIAALGGRHAHGELVGCHLGEHQCTGGPQAGDGRPIDRIGGPRVGRRPGPGRHSTHVNDVFDRHGHAMERADHSTGGGQGVEQVGLSSGLSLVEVHDPAEIGRGRQCLECLFEQFPGRSSEPSDIRWTASTMVGVPSRRNDPGIGDPARP